MLEWLSELNGFVRFLLSLVVMFGGAFILFVIYFYFKNKYGIFVFEKKSKKYNVYIKFYKDNNSEKLIKALEQFLQIYEASTSSKKDCNDLNNKLVDFLSKINARILDMKVSNIDIVNLKTSS